MKRQVSLWVVAPIIVLCASCSTPDERQEVGPGPSTVGESPPGPDGTEQQVAEQLPDWDPPTFTREDWLSWQHPNLQDPPDVPVVREVSMDEYLETKMACLEEQGFPGSQDTDGGLTYVTEPGQEDAFQLATYICDASYPLESRHYQPYSTSQLQIIYEWQLSETVPCLEGLGHEVEEPPTLAAYVDGYAATMAPVWSPYDSVPDLDIRGQQIHDIESSCPANPPAEVLYSE